MLGKLLQWKSADKAILHTAIKEEKVAASGCRYTAWVTESVISVSLYICGSTMCIIMAHAFESFITMKQSRLLTQMAWLPLAGLDSHFSPIKNSLQLECGLMLQLLKQIMHWINAKGALNKWQKWHILGFKLLDLQSAFLV